MHRASCLLLIVAAICTWNTVYLNYALDSLAQRGKPVAPEHVAHIAPMGWEHVNLLGRYSFDPREARALGNLRALRNETEIEVPEGSNEEKDK